MRVRCIHGYFIFEETRVGQISDFMSYFGLTLFPKDNYYTFEKLIDAPKYSLLGKPLLGFNAIETFEGEPWQVFEKNQVIYDFTLDQLIPISSVTKSAIVKPSGNRFYSPGLILPGSLTAEGMRIKDYAAWFSRDRLTWLYTEVSYV